MRNIKLFIIFSLVLFLFLSINPNSVSASSSSTKKVKVGQAIKVTKEDADYSSSNKSIAYVTPDGMVIGKKEGKATITVTTLVKGKKITNEIPINVVANEKKPSMDVCTGEIGYKVSLDFGEYNSKNMTIPYTANVTITNKSKKTADKVTVQFKIGMKKFTIKAGMMKGAGKYEEKISGSIKITVPKLKKNEADADVKLEKLLQKEIATAKKTQANCVLISVYSNKMYHKYFYETNEYTYEYGTRDKKKPKISGFIGKDSYSWDIYLKKELVPLMLVYSDKHKSYDYYKYVHVEDDRDVNCKLEVDTSKVNFKKTGVYNIKYIATDSSGNKATASAKIAVRVPNKLDKMADEVLSDILKPKMTEQQKAREIYEFTRNSFAYVNDSNKSNWEKAAIDGLSELKGDCFTFYAINRILCNRIGIPYIPVNRTPKYGRHWWALVYINNGFYHMDSTPRSNFYFGLVTDAQLKQYCKAVKRPHGLDFKDKPKTKTKVLYGLHERYTKKK